MISRALIEIFECIQDDETLGEAHGGMNSRIRFHATVGRLHFKDCWVSVCQPFDSDLESDPLTIGLPHGYPKDALWNVDDFKVEIESFYRNLVTSCDRDVCLKSYARRHRTKNKRIAIPHSFVLHLS